MPIGFQGGVSFVNKDKSGARLSDIPEGKKSAIQGNALDEGAIIQRKELYCGGAKPVSDALTAISKDLGISFRKESFAW